MTIQTAQNTGYQRIGLWADGKLYIRTIHRLVAMAFVANDLPKERTFVNHKDCNKKNNRAENLEWVTRKENAQHAKQNGKYRLCGLNFRNRGVPTLTDDDIVQIRYLRHVVGLTHKALRTAYGQCVRAASEGRTWTHV